MSGDYRRQIKGKQRRDARIYGGYAGAYTDEQGKSFFQRQREVDPNWGNDMTRADIDRAYWEEQDQMLRQQLPDIRNLPMPGATVKPSDIPAGFTINENGLAVRTASLPKMQAANNMKLTLGQESAPMFATPEQVKGGGFAWADQSTADRSKLLSDPNFYKSGEITKYAPSVQQEILRDPNFKWDQLPAWQKAYWEFSSRPVDIKPLLGVVAPGIDALPGKLEVQPMALAQGGIMGAGGGPVGVGVGMGLAVLGSMTGYDQTKEFWQQGDAKWTWDKQQIKDTVNAGFGLMNWAAEQAEKALGTAALAANAAADPNKNVADLFATEQDTTATWNAGAGTLEALGPAILDRLFPTQEEIAAGRLPGPVLGPEVLLDVLFDPEKYKGREYYLGAADAQAMDKTWNEQLTKARERIKNGENYRQVMTDMQTGIVAQMSDMIGQGIADPLNVMPAAKSAAYGKAADLSGNKVLAEAYKTTGSPLEAKQEYKTLVQTGEALKIDPNFKPLDHQGVLAKFLGGDAGVTSRGDVKAGGLFTTDTGLLDKAAEPYKWTEKMPGFVKNAMGYVQNMTEQDPYSRAQQGARMFYENVSAMLTMFDDPYDAVKYLKALAKGDNATWAELGSKFADSPEWYTVLPALKDFDRSKLDGIIVEWEVTAGNRDMLTRLANVLGEEPGKLLENGAAKQDFGRIVQRLEKSNSPEAKALLRDIEHGRFKVEDFEAMVKVFEGDKPLPWHPNQLKVQIMDALGSHFDEWVIKRLMLDKSPEAVSAFFRTTALMKQAQSILLLGGSPGYAITNGLSNMVHRAATGIYGYMTPGQINNFMDRMGVSPARFEEGVGIGGQVEMASGKSSVKTDAMSKAVKGKGPLTTAKENLGKLSSGMPFSKLSSWFEKNEGRQAFAIGMKDFWSQSWRRGKGFSKMPTELAGELQRAGLAPEHVYALIEGSMNQGEIEKFLTDRRAGISSRSLVNDAAQRSGMTAEKAAEMLDRAGVLDALDNHLKGKTDAEGVRAAFRNVRKVAQDFIEMQAGKDLRAQAEWVKQKVGMEGATGAMDVIQKTHGSFFDAWLENYSDFGEVMANLENITDEGLRAKVIDLAYQKNDDRMRRIFARIDADYKGVFDAWGLSNHPDAHRALSAFGEINAEMKGAYDFMRETRRAVREKYDGDTNNPAFWDELKAGNEAINKRFEKAFAAKGKAELKMGKALADIMENLYNPAAGQAALEWWQNVAKFNDQIVAREKEFRKSLEGMDKDQRAAAKAAYYGEDGEKTHFIVEANRINAEGIARLERAMKGGDGGFDTAESAPTQPPSGEGGATPPPTPPQVAAENAQQLGEGGTFRPAEMTDAERVAQIQQREAQKKGEVKSRAEEQRRLDKAAQERHAAEQAEIEVRLDEVRQVGEEYGYDMSVLQGRLRLVEDLKPYLPEGLTTTDPRWNSDEVRKALGKREADSPTPDPSPISKYENGEGGTPPDAGEDVYAMLQESGQTDGKLQARAESMDLIDRYYQEAVGLLPEFERLAVEGDADSLRAMVMDYSPEMNDAYMPDGRTWAQYMEDLYAKAEAKAEVDAIMNRNYENAARAEIAIETQQAKADAVEVRQLMREQFQAAFQLDDARADAWMEVMDANAKWAGDKLGISADEYYRRYYGEVRRGGEGTLNQDALGQGWLQRADVYQIERVRKEYKPTKRTDWADAAVQKFGTTKDIKEAGYILPDGQLLDLSGKRDGGIPGKRGYDHRDVGSVLPDEASPEGNATQYMLSFGNETGAIRIDGGGNGLKVDLIGTIPNAAQISALKKAMTGYDGITFDITDTRGNVILSGDLPNKKVSVDRIINEARRLFEGTETGEQLESAYGALFQEATPPPTPGSGKVRKGEVYFDPQDHIKATITAFEAADFTTLVHENGHVFRRVLADVAARTGDAQAVADLRTIEDWAGVKDGVWERAAEEKFTRGFEEYLTKGQAPTPALQRAFKQIKKWMLEIYKSITGSAIDVNISDDVKQVFGRMLGADGRTVADLNGQPTRVGERVVFGDRQMDVVNILDDGRIVLENEEGDSVTTRAGKFEKVARQQLVIDKEAAAREAAAMKASLEEGGMMDKVQLLKEQRAARNASPSADPSPNSSTNLERGAGEGRLYQTAQPTYATYTEYYQREMAGRQEAAQEIRDTFRANGLRLKFNENDATIVLYHGTTEAGRQAIQQNGFSEMSFFSHNKNASAFGSDGAAAYSKMRASKENPGAVMEIKVDPRDVSFNSGSGEFEAAAGLVLDRTDGVWKARERVYQNPNILYQMDDVFADADQPMGSYDAASGWRSEGEVMDEGWAQSINPLLDEMERGAVERVGGFAGFDTGEKNARPTQPAALSAEGQKALRQYMKKVQGEMATSKLAAMRYAEGKRDFAMLNYSRRYGFDRYAEVIYPYQFYQTRTMVNWAMRAMDKPAILSNYARLKNQMNRYERDIPERLRGKIKISAPWLPDWMGDGLYVDPIGSLFPPAALLKPTERMMQQTTYQQIEAERVLQEWAADGRYTQQQVAEAARTREGTLYERAFAEAQIRRESEVNNPMDFFNTMFGPAWYLTTPMNLALGKTDKVNGTPLGNTSRALETVTKGTWAEPVGEIFGLLGKAENWGKQKLGIPEQGEYGDYYIDRQLANMVAEGRITSDEATTAMIERQGALFEEAKGRVDMELAARVPGMMTLYAGLHGGAGDAAKAFVPSLFGAGLLPAGELEYRGLKGEWNEAWKRADAGDKSAVPEFFEEHPEYEAYLAKGKDPEERIKSYLIGQIWDGYMELGTTNQKAARAQMGQLFQQSFLDKETRSYEALDVETLTEWARMLGQQTPGQSSVGSGQSSVGSGQLPVGGGQSSVTLDLYSPEVTKVTDQFFAQRSEKFPNYYTVQSGYYALATKAEKTRYLAEHPELKAYWSWKDRWYEAYPEYKPVMNGDAFKSVDVSGWNPALVEYVALYAYTGKKLPKGARAALEQQWIREGSPMGSYQAWLDSQVVPGLLYGR